MKRVFYALITFFIFGLIILGGIFVYPQKYNQLADQLASKIGFKFPKAVEKDYKLGLDLQGGIHFVYEADMSQIPENERKDILEGLKDVIEKRVNFFGVTEPSIQTQTGGDKYRLIIELPGILDVTQAQNIIGKTPFLEFREPRDEQEIQKIIEIKEKIREALQNNEDITKIENFSLAFEDPYFKPTELTGKYFKKATLAFDNTAGKPIILIQFNDEGAKIFEGITEKNVGKPLAIYIDNQLLSAPIVQQKITGGSAQITGNFTIEEAKELVRNLNAGALPVPIKLVSQGKVEAGLGQESLQKSVEAGLWTFLIISIILLVVYRFSGFTIILTLVFFIISLLAIIKLSGITLTLASIGGIILSIGMAVDANILIVSRIKEELMEGKSINVAIIEGFRRAMPAIRDANITTLLTAGIMFFIGTSFLRGFAITLSLGIILSLINALIVQKVFLKTFICSFLEKHRRIIV